MEKKKSKKFRIFLSVVALVEVLILAAGITFSWTEGGNQAKISANEIMVTAGSSLTMMQDGKVSSAITIPVCNLDETSSADGRNFFFPMENNETNQTAGMVFREGTPQDENKKYVSLDFELIAGDTATDVFLGSGTIIECSNASVINALRMSFSTNDEKTPIVFKPNQMPGVTLGYSPITSISDSGTAVTGTTSTEAYGDYYYRGANSNQLFHLNKDETKHITLSIWLEGTTADFADAVAESNLNIYVDFSTQVDELVKYNFVDNTHGYGGAGGVASEHWITNKEDGNKYDTMMYVYDKTTSRYYSMQKSDTYSTDYTWTAYVPNTITNFSFRRYSIDIDEWWNEWPVSMSTMTTDPNGEHTYVSICGTSTGDMGRNLTPCGGYWKDSDGTYRIYFERSNSGWGNTIKCYAWNSSGASSSTSAWPGKTMTQSHTSDSGNPVYYVDLKETDNITGIQFNSGSSANVSEITNKDYFFNGFVHWFESSSSNGVYLYTGTANSKIFS